MRGRAFGITVIFVLAISTQGQLVFFDFNTAPASPPPTENMVPGVPTLVLSGTDVDVNGQEGTQYTDFSGTLHPPGLAGAFQSGVNAGDDTIVFTVDTTGSFGLVLSYDYRATLTGPSSSTLEYALPGGSFTPVGFDVYTRDALFHRTTWDLGGMSQLANAGEVRFRWIGFVDGTGTGTFRMDNLELTTVPEPRFDAFAAGLGLMAFVVQRSIARSHGRLRVKRCHSSETIRLRPVL
jgi:hypothetical protein